MKCRTKFCRGIVRKSFRSPYCCKCKHERFREKFPLKYAFGNLRRRALQRGIEFNLKYSEYEKFAILTNYSKLKGKTSLSLSIDRKDNSKGYSADNIQAITLRENSRKQFTNMPQWMKEEMRLSESGVVPDSHKYLLSGHDTL